MENPGLHNIQQQILRNVLGNVCTTSAGLAIGTSSAAAVKIANTTNYAIDSVLYQKTTAEIAFTDTTVQQASTFVKYLLSLDASGTGTLTAGNSASTSALALLPATPDDEVAIGYVEVATDSTHTFTPATTELSATGITDVYVNLMRNTGEQ
jgi:hypothetical protein